MLVTVIHGSPKGEISVTRQFIKYLELSFPDCVIDLSYVAAEIRRIESDQAYFAKILHQISVSDGIIWATPVYCLLIPSQMKRFIELIFEKNSQEAFVKK